VLLRGPNNPMMAACWFAVMKAGGVCVATMPLLRAKELTDIIQKAEVSHALCDKRLEGRAGERRGRLPDAQAGELLARRRARRPGRSLAQAAALVQQRADGGRGRGARRFHLGNHRQAQGTLHFHRDVVAMCDAFPRSILRTQKDDIFCGTPPIAFTFGLGGVLCFPMRYGAVHRAGREAHAGDAARDHRALQGYGLLLRPDHVPPDGAIARDFDLSSLKRCVSAGEALPDATRELFREATGIEIIDGIGSTEMIHIFISHLPERARRGATGYAIPGYRAAVLDEEGRVCAPGTVGRLAVKGPTGCRYLADERQKEYVQKGWNITGDAYLRDEDGYFFYQARTDDMIISAGYNIAGPGGGGRVARAPGGRRMRGGRGAGRRAGYGRQGLRRPEKRIPGDHSMAKDAAGARQGRHRALQVSAPGRISPTRCPAPRPASCSGSS
jgi:2-aminobenzoate-CoA ligase